MNEDAQIQAMMAELEAEGYAVRRDVPASEFGGKETSLILDLVASPMMGRGRTLVVEIANRCRRPGADDLFPDAELSEEVALGRFELISKLVRSSKSSADFQIRFFDVSADQANARTLIGTSVFNPESVLSAYEELASALADMAVGEKSRILLIAHSWARWLRMTAYRWPAARREMPDSDLRKIQKDLFDAKIVSTSPADYHRTHRSVLAAIEGGDVEWDRLEALEGDLLLVAKRLAEHVGKSIDESDKTQAAKRQRPDEVFEFVERALRNQFAGDRRDQLLKVLHGLRDTDGTPRYTEAFGRFLIEVNTDWPSLRGAIDRLINRALPKDKLTKEE
jgi:hypothetical protein